MANTDSTEVYRNRTEKQDENDRGLLQKPLRVIPAKAGIEAFQGFLDCGRSLPRTTIRGRGDGFFEFSKSLDGNLLEFGFRFAL
jgi:hypothetical protein